MKIAVTTESHESESTLEQQVETQIGDHPADAATTGEAHTTTAEDQPTGIAAGLEALGLDGKLLAAQIINFVILLLVLRKFLYKPLVGLLEKRRDAIEEGMKKTEEIEKRYTEFQTEHMKRIEESKAEATAMIEKAKKAAEEIRQDTLTKTTAETEAMLTRAKEEIERGKEKMLQELKQEVGTLVVAATAKVIGKAIGKDEQDKLIKEALNEVK